MKRKLYSMLLFFIACNCYAQPSFQMHYENQLGFGFDGDHYSIETAPEDAPYAYACAGTFFDPSSGQQHFHVFTTDQFGEIIWEIYSDQPEGRILDVAINKDNFDVAVTGFKGAVGSEELYVGLLQGSDGTFLNDITMPSQSLGINTTGTTIYYTEAVGAFVVGGLEYTGPANTPTGRAIYMLLKPESLNIIWEQRVLNSCSNHTMSSINDISSVEGYIFLTGAIETPTNLGIGNKQVLGLLIDPQTGHIIQNLSHVPTAGVNHRAIGTSAHYNEETMMFHWMYNVSVPNSSYVDENRPYILNYTLDPSAPQNPLVFFNAFKLQNQLWGVVPGYNSPNITGLSLTLANEQQDHYVLSGIVEAYGGGDDKMTSFYQILDINTGLPTDYAYLWENSEIASGFTGQGGFYSFINSNFLNANFYTPKSTTTGLRKESFVSIVPSTSTNNSYTHDLASQNFASNPLNNNCLHRFIWHFNTHTPLQHYCLEIDHYNYEIVNPVVPYTFNTNSIAMSTCGGRSPINQETTGYSAPILKIYPNPANEKLNFEISEKGNSTVEIINLSGRKVYSKDLTSESNFNRIDISKLTPGIYFFKAMFSNGNFRIEKFVKE